MARTLGHKKVFVRLLVVVGKENGEGEDGLELVEDVNGRVYYACAAAPSSSNGAAAIDPATNSQTP